MTVRKPVQFATYHGDVSDIVNDGRKGPNTLGEWLYPVTADYDPAANETRVGFSYLAPEVSS